MADDVRHGLSRALASINPDYARMVTDRMTDVDEYPAPFLNNYKIYKVLYSGPYKPILFYVGYAQGKPAYLLTGSMDNYQAMARADRVEIGSADRAESYVAVALEVTRSMSGLYYMVDSADKLKWRGLMDEADEKARQDFIDGPGSEIGPPKAEPAGDGFAVTAYAVRNQSVEKYKFNVSRRGDLKSEVTVIAKDLPLMFGL